MGIAGLLKDAAIYSSWFNSWNLAFTTIFWTSALIHFSRIPATIYIVFLCVVTSHEWILCTFIARTKLFGPQNYLTYGLNYFSPQKYSEPLSPNISNVILFGNRVFTKVIKLKRGLRGPYNNMTGVLYKTGSLDNTTHRGKKLWRDRKSTMWRPRIGMMPKPCPRCQQTTRGQEEFSNRFHRERGPDPWHLGIGILVSRIVRQFVFFFLSYPVCRTWFGQAWKADTDSSSLHSEFSTVWIALCTSIGFYVSSFSRKANVRSTIYISDLSHLSHCLALQEYSW